MADRASQSEPQRGPRHKTRLSPRSAACPGSPEAALKTFIADFTDPRPIGVAVSGGSDSTALLVALAEVAADRPIIALTVDHGLRAASPAEAAAVGALCRSLGVKHVTLSWTGEKPKSGLQAAARVARYGLLAAAAERYGLAAIATAHTADDQAETLEMRRTRHAAPIEPTSGNHLYIPGLTGIPPATLYNERVWFVRPLLMCRRGDLQAYLRLNGVGWIEDPSNADRRFERVRVRQDGVKPVAGLAPLWAERAARSAAVAQVLDAGCRRLATDRFELVLPGVGQDIAAGALAACIDMAGGRLRQPDRAGRAKLMMLARGNAAMPVTLGRVLVHSRGPGYLLRRERRNVLPISVAAGAEEIFDGRFRIRNAGRSAVQVLGGGEDGILPELSCTEGGQGVPCGHVMLERLCGRASRLLPVFDTAQAAALARLAERTPFAACPWTGWAKAAP
ncbi:tRNA lysidine(34) synthetase TilS [Pseudohoeflea coraliihabitans]|uniref:tRNA(Ile)-lysidine synthase n=1 Tax=Pseudohoeflea coraliihabitans TaxID=2860393 RepID=A0ABS6WK16_9HYPH|nr:tRNA lysidine(34) synthetase TilS [Pseudohoeflea sp. DP4N28-3]MBW3096291.1 tRNA lysidine(34) synthetase TilS [Pseudohoeflea sp. DP4N28-3]